jgi:hypothetical protein
VPSLSRITARFTRQILSQVLAQVLTKTLAILLLAAIAAPFAHAALEISEHEQCGMEACKRAGKCCCRRSQPGKLHWDAKDDCHHGTTQFPAIISPAIAPEPLAVVTILHTTRASLPAISIARPGNGVRVTQFQRPPPTLS